MNNCNTCRHWRRDRFYREFREREPAMDIVDTEWGQCMEMQRHIEGVRCPPMVNPVDEETRGSLAYAWDLENIQAGLSTRSNFGCVQWEAK